MSQPETGSGYPVEAVANFFIEVARQEKIEMTHLKLQKLIYIAHGWCLALLGRQLIDETPQAWKYGPVIKSLYHALKHSGSSPIKELVSLPDTDENGKLIERFPRLPETDSRFLMFLRSIWDAYKKASPSELVYATHKQGTPWEQVYKKGEMSIPIPHDTIKSHYEKLRDRGRANAA